MCASNLTSVKDFTPFIEVLCAAEFNNRNSQERNKSKGMIILLKRTEFPLTLQLQYTTNCSHCHH